MAKVIMTAPLIVRLPGTDVTIGEVTFTDGETPDVSMSEEGVRLACDTATATMTVPDGWAFGGHHGEGS